MKNAWVVVALVVYVALILDMTLRWFPDPHPVVNLVPFRTMAHDLRWGGRDFVVNFVGNVVVFLPLGALLWRLDPRRVSAWKVVAAAAAFSGSIELAQWFSGRRVCDVDDILLNTAGALLGYLLATRALRPGARSVASTPAPTEAQVG